MLEMGVSPDGLPINPPKVKFTDLLPGHHSYRRTKLVGGKYIQVTEWFTIRGVGTCFR